MFERSSIILQLITFACPMESGQFQVNEQHTRELEALSPAYTTRAVLLTIDIGENSQCFNFIFLAKCTLMSIP